MPDLVTVLPEITLLTAACVVLLAEAFASERYRGLVYELAQASLVVTAVTVALGFPAEETRAFSGMYVLDPMASVLKLTLLVVGYFVFLYAREYLEARSAARGEFYLMGLFALLGMMVLVSAGSLLTVYLGLELLSLSLYALVALNRDSDTASEAAMKYFVLGALASGMLLYGMSMLYGATGTLDLQGISAAAAQADTPRLVLVFGLVFVVVGLAFKLGAVPFHMWIPDVYQGAPTAMTLFIASAPKIAAFAMTYRLLVDALPGLSPDWRQMLLILAVLSMAIGNVAAIAQTNVKRMLAYSTIAHVGFLLLGFIAGTPAGYSAAMFYTIVYALTGMGAFGLVILLGRTGFEADRLEDFKGLNERSPWFAFVTLVLMLSMAGVPPFVGFWAKWSVLAQVVAAGYVWLAVAAVGFAIVGAFYYLRVVWYAYFDRPTEETPITAGRPMRVMLSVNALAVLGLGVYPGALMAVCVAALAA
ncbi:MAG: NADH-quinone oxidoreductase subunit NuoN [Gammaproteobacteria bacterium]|jgi:NADH-quinone oxidoreductase subunit N|nr:NADH-quinone oxidoreductase subunit NuoN [Gammaproteobacteria bacterium]